MALVLLGNPRLAVAQPEATEAQPEAAEAQPEAAEAQPEAMEPADERAEAEAAAEGQPAPEAQDKSTNSPGSTQESSSGGARSRAEGAAPSDEPKRGWELVTSILKARCATAFCFDNGTGPGKQKYWLGIEPLVELPVGKSVALSKSALGAYVNNHDVKVDLAAGVRVWFFRDLISLAVYLSKPLTDARVRLEGSEFVYPAASVRRPYPGIGVGLLFDTLWLGFDREELRNGDGQDSSSLNPEYPPNELVSSSWTLTVAIQPVTAFRTAIGTAAQRTDSNSEDAR